MRLGRNRCGKPRAFQNCVEFLRLCRPEAEPQTIVLPSGKPEAFRKGSGKAANNYFGNPNKNQLN